MNSEKRYFRYGRKTYGVTSDLLCHTVLLFNLYIFKCDFFLVIYIQQLHSIKVDLDKNTRYHVNDREKVELTMRSYTEVTLIHTSITPLK